MTGGRRLVDDTFPLSNAGGGTWSKFAPLVVDNAVGEGRSLHATCPRRIWTRPRVTPLSRLVFVTRTIDDMSHDGIRRRGRITILHGRVHAPESMTNPGSSLYVSKCFTCVGGSYDNRPADRWSIDGTVDMDRGHRCAQIFDGSTLPYIYWEADIIRNPLF